MEHIAERDFYRDVARPRPPVLRLGNRMRVVPIEQRQRARNAGYKAPVASFSYLSLDDVRDILPLYVRAPGTWSVS
jgi:hypothetical protein